MLKQSCAAFFTKRDEALRAKFGGDLPVGRPLAQVQESGRREFLDGFRSSYSLYGFASPDEAEAWAMKGTITRILPYLHAQMPQFDPSSPGNVDFPLVLP